METSIKSIQKHRETKKIQNENGHSLNGHTPSKRLPVQKTYKLYIDGKFPRTESGRLMNDHFRFEFFWSV